MPIDYFQKLFVIIKTNFFKKDIDDSAVSVLGMIPEIRFVETRDAVILGCSDFWFLSKCDWQVFFLRTIAESIYKQTSLVLQCKIQSFFFRLNDGKESALLLEWGTNNSMKMSFCTPTFPWHSLPYQTKAGVADIKQNKCWVLRLFSCTFKTSPDNSGFYLVGFVKSVHVQLGGDNLSVWLGLLLQRNLIIPKFLLATGCECVWLFACTAVCVLHRQEIDHHIIQYTWGWPSSFRDGNAGFRFLGGQSVHL